MSEYGHSKVSRKAFLPLAQGGDPFWNEPRTFSRWEAWEYLFAHAARYGSHTWVLRSGAVIELQRGETTPLSVRYLAQRWKWGKDRVARFLSTLVSMQRIAIHQHTSDGDTYLVVNYDTYQGVRDSDETESATETRQRPDSDATKEKQVKQVKQVKQRENRLHAIPDLWRPNDAHREFAKERGVDVEEEAASFRDHAEANGRKLLSWDAGFRQWLRKAKPAQRSAIPAADEWDGSWVAELH